MSNQEKNIMVQKVRLSIVKFCILFGLMILVASCTKSNTTGIPAVPNSLTEYNSIAPTPPMGWNSYDCFGASVTEAEVKANADIMAVHLKKYGWEYIVVDYCWFYPYSAAMGNPDQHSNFTPSFPMDEYGRLFPAVDKFPSSADGKGFKPLVDYIHSKGLKFGIHVMRGIPREAVAKNTFVKGSKVTAKEICDSTSKCPWLNSMFGVDCTKEGAQEYYNSIINLYVSWGVDYIKVDDLSSPYSSFEIEAIHKAIVNSGRNIVFSLSPGATPIEKANHVKQYANLWRISSDFWDDWPALKKQFDICHMWEKEITPGHWPDADMIPIGLLSRRGPEEKDEHRSYFTREEQKTLMTLWAIFRSPLMFGGDLTMISKDEFQLITNSEVLAVNQNSANNHQLFRDGDKVAWIADVPESRNKYVALFNLGEKETTIEVSAKELGFTEPFSIRNLWEKKDLSNNAGSLIQTLPPHGAGIYLVGTKAVSY
jgi:hypothetical protein